MMNIVEIKISKECIEIINRHYKLKENRDLLGITCPLACKFGYKKENFCDCRFPQFIDCLRLSSKMNNGEN